MSSTAEQIREALRKKREAAAVLSAKKADPGPAPPTDAAGDPLPVERPGDSEAPSPNGAEPSQGPDQRAIVPRGGPGGRAQADRRSTGRIAPRTDLPHSVEAEAAILGCLIGHARRAVPEAAQKVAANYFYVPAHEIIFREINRLFTDQGDLDLVTLTNYMRDVGQLETAGGPGYVTELLTANYPPSSLSYYLDIVRDKYALREFIKGATENIRQAYEDAADVPALLELARRRLEVAQGATSRFGRLPDLRDLSMLLGENRPPRPAELVKGLLHQGSKLIVGGTSKGRKTFSLIDLAVSVASGTPWWGFETVPGPVCYINFEIQESFFCGRTEDICRVKGVTLPPKMLMGWNLRGHGEGIENMVSEIMSTLLTRSFVLVIFDPIYKALGNRDENKAGDVASLCNELERIAVRTGAAIAFGAHYSKGNQAAKESIDRIGGSGVFARDPDSILTMTTHEEPNAFTVEATLRNFQPLDPFVVKWDWPLFTRQADLDPGDLKQARQPGTGAGQFKPKFSLDDILDHLSVAHGQRPTAIKNLSNVLRGMSRATFYRLARELEQKGLLIERDGEWFRGTKEDQKE